MFLHTTLRSSLESKSNYVHRDTTFIFHYTSTSKSVNVSCCLSICVAAAAGFSLLRWNTGGEDSERDLEVLALMAWC